MIVKSMKEAWSEADKIIPTDYMKDESASDRAGYPIYRSTAENCNAYICDLADRLEVNLDDGTSVNIWVKEEVKEEKHTCVHMTHWNSDDWCRDNRATTQEELQKIAKSIRENCKGTGVVKNGKTSTCTMYENENLGIRYWVHDDLGRISEIIEERNI